MDLHLEWDTVGYNKQEAYETNEIEYDNANVSIFVHAIKYLESDTNSTSIIIKDLSIEVTALFDEEGTEIKNEELSSTIKSEVKSILNIY